MEVPDGLLDQLDRIEKKIDAIYRKVLTKLEFPLSDSMCPRCNQNYKIVKNGTRWCSCIGEKNENFSIY